ncbi:hypothetical protein GOBAR_AA36133 [Gossypium barbadense]|uniref:Uncharacterized protein n=1 Tax=Gossypium barbadense TaxID=3634 RepID=A0A2P5W0I1_GOSBA|nr:hypothetical protein GOBAR_AA36133 [Gossypium barbadense]
MACQAKGGLLGVNRGDLVSDRFESGGEYSGGRRSSLGHKSYAKRILYLVVAMVVVEQDMAVVENLLRWSCSSYVMMSLGVLYNYDKIRNFLGDIRNSCLATIPRPCFLGVCGTRPYGTAVPSCVHFYPSYVKVPHSCMVVYGLMARACLTPVSKKQNQVLFLARPWVSIPTPVYVSNSPTAMSHGRGDLSYPVFWGNHVLLQHCRIARPCVFPCLATALGTLVCLACRTWDDSPPLYRMEKYFMDMQKRNAIPTQTKT